MALVIIVDISQDGVMVSILDSASSDIGSNPVPATINSLERRYFADYSERSSADSCSIYCRG